MVLLRFTDGDGKPVAAWPALELTDAPVMIGRHPGAGLRLLDESVRYQHATLQLDRDGLLITALDGARLGLPDAPCDQLRLATPGETARIGGFLLTLKRRDAGQCDIVITRQTRAADETARANQYFARFDVRLPNIRLWGFALTCLTILAFFMLPVLTLSGPLKPAVPKTATPVATGLLTQAAFSVADLWSVGVMSHAHAGFGANCAACHETPFVRVRASACLICHQGTGQHASAPRADISATRCETCHLEHKGPTMAVHDRQADCDACHGNIKRWAPNTAEPDILDFGWSHPQFRPALIADAAAHTARRFALGTVNAPDHSNLKFTHATHLKLAKLRDAAGQAACQSCHLPDADGTSFRRVEFQTACAACHTLQFEPNHPEWRLPHGHPEELASRIAGFYATAALNNETFVDPPTDPFRKPGTDPALPPATGRDMVDLKTAQAMVSSVAHSACGECHHFAPPAAGDSSDSLRAALGIKIAPVFLADRFMPSAMFAHDKHATTPCQTCHQAEASNGGPLALLPGIETCRICHAGEGGAAQRVASTCTLCHQFHDECLPLVKSPQREACAFKPTILSSPAEEAQK